MHACIYSHIQHGAHVNVSNFSQRYDVLQSVVCRLLIFGGSLFLGGGAQSYALYPHQSVIQWKQQNPVWNNIYQIPITSGDIDLEGNYHNEAGVCLYTCLCVCVSVCARASLLCVHMRHGVCMFLFMCRCVCVCVCVIVCVVCIEYICPVVYNITVMLYTTDSHPPNNRLLGG
jgi:hypothetical protein